MRPSTLSVNEVAVAIALDASTHKGVDSSRVHINRVLNMQSLINLFQSQIHNVLHHTYTFRLALPVLQLHSPPAA